MNFDYLFQEGKYMDVPTRSKFPDEGRGKTIKDVSMHMPPMKKQPGSGKLGKKRKVEV